MKRLLIGHVPVDSAGLVIADPAVLPRWQDDSEFDIEGLLPDGAESLNDMHKRDAPELPFSRNAAWVANGSRTHGGVLGDQSKTHVGEVYGLGVAVSTGLGDGLYPVYAEIIEEADVEGEKEVVKMWLRNRVARIVIDCGLLDEESEG